MTGDPGDDTIYLGPGRKHIYGEEGFNTVYNQPNDGDTDVIFCGWIQDQNYGRVIYSAPTGSDPGPGQLFFGDNVKCCTVWTKDPTTGVETEVADENQVRCALGRQAAS